MNDHTDPAQVAASLRAALGKLNRRLRGQDDPSGAGSTGLALLGRLYRQGAATATMLATQERLQPQSLTRILATLEAKKLIVRTADDLDRRRSHIEITEEGVRFLQRTVLSREAWLANAIVATLSATELDLLRLSVMLLERLADAEE
ncbi:MAG: MarR family transcriptional regulator [Candidatus Eremiobacteraeota bacterium]|nr:MarR family transcriptional regulator [Candidatus Eremiobacteraeota bacterium]